MLWVPRSWAASPCVIERQTEILSATFAVSFISSEKTSPSRLVFTVPNGPLDSIGASGLGSNDSWADMPPGRKMWISDWAVAFICWPGLTVAAALARALR